MILSRYARLVSHMRLERTASMRRAKFAGGLQKPKGRTVNSYSCLPLVEKAVYDQWLGHTGTFQYPNWRSRVENHLAPRRAQRELSIRGRGVASFMVALLRNQ